MFIKEPEAFASFRDELTFEYSQEEVTDLIFEIELRGNNDYAEVKKLYDVSSATLNIAPIVANEFMTTPSSGESTLETPESGYGLVALRCGDEATEASYFVASKCELPEVGVISSMATNRVISYTEADEIWIRAAEGAELLVMVETTNEGGTTSTDFEHTVEECGLARFRFDTNDFGAYTKIAKVYIFCDGESIEEVTYYYVPRMRDSVRLAWIGDYGGVEHYTFPVTNAITRLKNDTLIFEIESAYESKYVVSALSEILCSERVWMVEGDSYTEVNILSELVVLNKSGELSTVEYKIERYD